MKKSATARPPLLALAITLAQTCMVQAQGTDFTVRGFANTSFVWQDDKTNFQDLGLTPIFLWATERMLVESELEITSSGPHGAELGLGYVTLNYDLTPSLRAQVGKFLLPFGIFGPRLHPSWINKLPTPPLGLGHEDLSPMADIGAGLRGILPFGNFRFGYYAFVANGPQLSTDTLEAGMLHFGMEDNNGSKALGGRVELVRLSQASWEIGLSGMFGDAGPGNMEAMAALGAVDFSYQRPSSLLRGVVDLKSQGNWIQVNRKEYAPNVRFQNRSWNYVVQLAYRPTLANRQWIRNLEGVGRVSQLQYPRDAPWFKEGTEWAIGLDYWLSWNSLVKVAWITGGDDHADVGMPGMPGMPAEQSSSGHMDGKLVVQMAIGL